MSYGFLFKYIYRSLNHPKGHFGCKGWIWPYTSLIHKLHTIYNESEGKWFKIHVWPNMTRCVHCHETEIRFRSRHVLKLYYAKSLYSIYFIIRQSQNRQIWRNLWSKRSILKERLSGTRITLTKMTDSRDVVSMHLQWLRKISFTVKTRLDSEKFQNFHF